MTYFRGEGPGRGRKQPEAAIASFRVACGQLIGPSDIEKAELETPGSALLPLNIPYAKGIFTARGFGTSMEPWIKDGNSLFFHPHVVGTRQDRFVLVEDQGTIGGERYTLKKYRSKMKLNPDGTSSHDWIRLHSLNPEYPPIPLDPDGRYRIVGWYVGQAKHIQRVETYRYPDADE